MKNYKADFPIFKNYPGLAYFDSAATSQKPQVVIDSIVDFYLFKNANVHRGIYPLSELATLAYEQARKEVAEFLEVDSREIIFTSGSTAGANMIAQSYLAANLTAGDIIISSVAEHHSNFLPLQRVASTTNSTVKLINLNTDFELDYEMLDDLLKANTNKIKALAFSAVSNVLGIRLNLERIVKLTRKYSPQAKIIIDGAQIVGHHNISLKDLDIDFFFFSGHKIFAATGIGVLWAKEGLLAAMSPYQLGGGMIEKVTEINSTFTEIPERFEAGTPNIEGAISLGAAVKYIANIGIKNIENKLAELSSLLKIELETIPNCKIYGSTTNSSQSDIFSFSIDIHPHDIAQFLGERQVCVRA